MQTIPWPTLKPKEQLVVEKVIKYWFQNEHQDIFSPEYAFQRYLWFEGGLKIDKQIKVEFESVLATVAFDVAPDLLIKSFNDSEMLLFKKSIAIDKHKKYQLALKESGKEQEIDKGVEDFFALITDEDIREYLINKAKETREQWKLSPSSLLALVLLFDQFPRNIYRSTKNMFIFSEELKSILRQLIRDLHEDVQIITPKFHEELEDMFSPFCERLFIYLSFLHFEEEYFVDIGNQGIKFLHDKLIANEKTASDTKAIIQTIYSGSQYQLFIIKKFGRYPHRNLIIGRESTKEEIEFFRSNPLPFIATYQESNEYLSIFSTSLNITSAAVEDKDTEFHIVTDRIVHKDKRTKLPITNNYYLNFDPLPISAPEKQLKKIREGSSSFFVRQAPSESKHKLKILMLHGYKQSAGFLKSTTRKLIKSLIEVAELVYVDGPFQVPQTNNENEDNSGVKIAKFEKLCWYLPSDDNMRYEGLQHSLDYLGKIWESKGPFDGIIGQSQGGVLASILSSLLQHRISNGEGQVAGLKLPSQINFDFIISISAFQSSPEEHKNLWIENFIGTPSIHVIGENDKMVLPERTVKLSTSFKNPSLVYHDGQHFSPSKWPVDQISTFLAAQSEAKIQRINEKVDENNQVEIVQEPSNIIEEEEVQLPFEDKLKEALATQKEQNTTMLFPSNLSRIGKELFNSKIIQAPWSILRAPVIDHEKKTANLQEICDAYQYILSTFGSKLNENLTQSQKDHLIEDVLLIIFSIRTKGDQNSQQRYCNFLIEAYLYFYPTYDIKSYIFKLPQYFGGWTELCALDFSAIEKKNNIEVNKEDNSVPFKIIKENQTVEEVIELLENLHRESLTIFANQLKEDNLKLQAIKNIRKQYPTPYQSSIDAIYHSLIPTSSQIDAKLFVDHLKENNLWPSNYALTVPNLRSYPDKQANIAKDIAILLNPLHVPRNYDEKKNEGDDPLLYTKGKSYKLFRILVKDLRAVLACGHPLVRKNLIQRQQVHQHSAKVSKQVWEELLNRPLSDEVLRPKPRPVLPCSLEDLQPLLDFLSNNTKPGIQTPFTKGTIVPDGRLDLCKQVVGPKGIAPLLDSMKGNEHVSRLLLGNNIIGNYGAVEIAKAIATHSIPNMDVWYLGGNEFDEKGISEIANALENDKFVVALWLKLNPVGPLGSAALAKMLRVNTHLVTLDLVNTGILDEGFISIIDALQESPSNVLRHFYAGSNGLTARSGERLRDFFVSGANRMETLYISTNRLGDVGLIEISKGIRSDRYLKVFSVASNRITQVGLAPFVDALIESKHPLDLLDLAYPKNTAALGELGNSIGDEGAALLAKLLVNLPLKSLRISNNMITRVGIEKITRCFKIEQYSHRLEVLSI